MRWRERALLAAPLQVGACRVLGVGSLILAWQFLLPLAGVPAYIVPTPTAIFAHVPEELAAAARQSLADG